jgi:hypothetical protein
MASPQLLISHSTEKDRPRRKIVDELAKKLGKRFAVLLDRTTIVPGESWRNTLNVWTGTCDAAVVLVTPQSIASEFCQYEWSILGLRRALDKAFRVVPIYAGLTPDEIARAPHQLGAIQGATGIELKTVPAACARLLKALAGVARGTGTTPAERQAQFVAAMLRRFVNDDDALVRAADSVQLDLGPWNPTQDKALRLALRLLGTGVDRAIPALDELLPFFTSDRDTFYELLDLVACSWVDLSASTAIEERAAAASTRLRGVALNAAQPGTAQLCVLRASGRPPRNAWRVAKVPNVFETLEQLTTQVYDALAPLFAVPAPPADRARVADALRRAEKFNNPVFVALREDGLKPKWLAELRKEFETVTFFLLTARRAVGDASYPDVKILRPPLHDGFESAFWTNYEDAKGFFDDKAALFKG